MTRNQSVSRRNEQLTLIASFLGDLAFILPIWVLFGTNELGFSTTLTTALFMTVWIGSGLLEIPTGALADRLGRRRMYLYGVALLALHPFAYIFKLPVFAIFLLSVIVAFGSALRSGTLLALTHESFKQDGRSEKAYHQFLSTNKIYVFTARAISGVAGGIMYELDPRLPFVAILITYVLMFGVGLFIVDTAKERSKLSNRLHIAETIKVMKQKAIIRSTLVIYFVAMLIAEAMWTGFQPIFEGDGVAPQNIGLIFSVIAIISAVAAYTVRHLMRRIGALKIEVIVAFTMTLGSFLLFLPATAFHIASIIPIAFAFGLTLTPVQAVTQKFTPSKLHSTALSTMSVIQYGVYGIASISLGILIDVLGPDSTRTILFAGAVVMSVFVSVYYLVNRDIDAIVTQKD